MKEAICYGLYHFLRYKVCIGSNYKAQASSNTTKMQLLHSQIERRIDDALVIGERV